MVIMEREMKKIIYEVAKDVSRRYFIRIIIKLKSSSFFRSGWGLLVTFSFSLSDS